MTMCFLGVFINIVFLIWRCSNLLIEILTFLVSTLTHLGPCEDTYQILKETYQILKVFSLWEASNLLTEILTLLVSNLTYLGPCEESYQILTETYQILKETTFQRAN